METNGDKSEQNGREDIDPNLLELIRAHNETKDMDINDILSDMSESEVTQEMSDCQNVRLKDKKSGQRREEMPEIACQEKGCQFKTCSLQSLHGHRRIHFLPVVRKKKRFTTEICQNKDYEREHEKKPLKCKNCSQCFLSKRLMEKHLEERHRIKTKKRLEEVMSCFECDVCHKRFSEEANLKRHAHFCPKNRAKL